MDSINLAKCNNCVKRDVCSIKEEINEIINSIEDLLAKETTSKDIDFSLRCKHFQIENPYVLKRKMKENL